MTRKALVVVIVITIWTCVFLYVRRNNDGKNTENYSKIKGNYALAMADGKIDSLDVPKEVEVNNDSLFVNGRGVPLLVDELCEGINNSKQSIMVTSYVSESTYGNWYLGTTGKNYFLFNPKYRLNSWRIKD